MKLKFFVTLMLVTATTILLNGTFVNASEISAEKIFNKATVDKLIEKADAEVVYKDNKKANSLVTNLVRAEKTSGVYLTRKGVILVTSDAYKNLIPTGHAAIVYNASKVVESLSKGVTTGKNNWYDKKKTCYGVTTYDTTALQDAYVADWCYSQISKKYNYNYFNVNTRKKFYCSQLVWAGYFDKQDIDLDTALFGWAIHPMELVYTSETYTIYKKTK